LTAYRTAYSTGEDILRLPLVSSRKSRNLVPDDMFTVQLNEELLGGFTENVDPIGIIPCKCTAATTINMGKTKAEIVLTLHSTAISIDRI
jgi:hypothetical protein